MFKELVEFLNLKADEDSVELPMGKCHKTFLTFALWNNPHMLSEIWDGEWVMCVNTDHIAQKMCDNPALLPQTSRATWLPRPFAEQCTELRHVIPYIAIWHPETNRFLAYQRKGGGEARLEGQWSIGWGGHVNPCDWQDELDQTVYACAQRELKEELPALDWTQVGLMPLYVYQDSDAPVNSVHVCLGMLAQYYGPIIDGQWKTMAELSSMELESWSSRLLAWLALAQEKYDEANSTSQRTDNETP